MWSRLVYSRQTVVGKVTVINLVEDSQLVIMDATPPLLTFSYWTAERNSKTVCSWETGWPDMNWLGENPVHKPKLKVEASSDVTVYKAEQAAGCNSVYTVCRKYRREVCCWWWLLGLAAAAVWGRRSDEDVWPSSGQCQSSHLPAQPQVLRQEIRAARTHRLLASRCRLAALR